MVSKEKHRCSASVWREHSSCTCSRNGVNYEGGGWWCKQHTPSILNKKREDEKVRWDKEWKEKQARWKENERIGGIKDKLYEAYDDGNIPDAILDRYKIGADSD